MAQASDGWGGRTAQAVRRALHGATLGEVNGQAVLGCDASYLNNLTTTGQFRVHGGGVSEGTDDDNRVPTGRYVVVDEEIRLQVVVATGGMVLDSGPSTTEDCTIEFWPAVRLARDVMRKQGLRDPGLKDGVDVEWQSHDQAGIVILATADLTGYTDQGL